MEALGTLIPLSQSCLLSSPPTWGLEVPDQGGPLPERAGGGGPTWSGNWRTATYPARGRDAEGRNEGRAVVFRYQPPGVAPACSAFAAGWGAELEVKGGSENPLTLA